MAIAIFCVYSIFSNQPKFGGKIQPKFGGKTTYKLCTNMYIYTDLSFARLYNGFLKEETDKT